VTLSAGRRSVLVAVPAAAMVAGAMFAVHPAQAAPAPSPASATTASALADRLGSDHTAGTYRDKATGRMVVNVTDAATAQQVAAAGATPRMVSHTATELRSATTALNSSARVPGTAWSTDPVTNQVVVKVDKTVSAAKLATVQSVASRYGSAVRVVRTAGTYSLRTAGGDAIWGSGFRCSLGFNVTNGSTNYFITAGHCGNAVPNWYSDQGQSNLIGSTADSVFPGSDYAIVQYTTGVSDSGGTVDLYPGTQDITSAGNAFVGESVQRSGSTTGVFGGTVLATDATVNYAEGTVTGLIDTNVCAEPGDSGGALFDGSTALGLTSGGSGNCSSGGETFFQPITEPLAVYGVNVY
jgi:streptogrisin D